MPEVVPKPAAPDPVPPFAPPFVAPEMPRTASGEASHVPGPSQRPTPSVATEAVLRVERLCRYFPVGTRGSLLHAVDDVDLAIGPGESIGLVGESGCGKSTLARLVARLIDPTSGRIVLQGEDVADQPARRFARHPQRGAVQMVFQDPTDSLNPRFTAREAIGEPLRLLAALRGTDLARRVDEVATQVGLPLALLSRFPHQLSGGQKARVGIARALALKPRLLILDEPTSALDVSVQAVVLQLLAQLRSQLGLSYLFVSHDLNVVRLLTDRVVVMYLGKVVETGPVEQVFRAPRHPYTKALVSAIPGHGAGDRRIRLSGEVRSPIDPPRSVCRFHGRCPRGEDQCARQAPALRQVAEAQWAACHFD